MIRTCGWPSARRREWAHLPEDDLKVQVGLIKTGVGALVREGTPMLKVVHDSDASNENRTAGGSLLDEIVRDGARQMLAAALPAEVAAYVDAHAGEVDEHGRRLVVRNGHHHQREVLTAAGAVQRDGRRGSTTSASTPIPGSGNGSPRRSCRRGRVSRRR